MKGPRPHYVPPQPSQLDKRTVTTRTLESLIDQVEAKHGAVDIETWERPAGVWSCDVTSSSQFEPISPRLYVKAEGYPDHRTARIEALRLALAEEAG
ncbi:MAG: hypothetical protein AAFV53_35440 [Myxococcota bacterium]